MLRPLRRTSMRIVPSVEFNGSDTGTKLSPLSIAALGAVDVSQWAFRYARPA
jgi:hypothetical protein